MLVPIALLTLLAVASGTDYCTICKDRQQTLCKYSGVSSSCGQVYARGVESGLRQYIVDQHNMKRNRVALGQEQQGDPGPQPPAKDMRKMYWDDELAAVAQRWVEQCIWGHDACRNVDRYYVGQNMYMTMSSSSEDRSQNWAGAVDGWYNEVSKQNKNYIQPFVSTSATGHYTQVVWGKSNRIGCGYIMFYDSESKWYKKVYGCDYGPGGNVQGMNTPVYEIGASCSMCPQGCDSTYRGLCV